MINTLGYIDLSVYEKLIKQYKNKTEKISFILEHFPEARNNDNYLVYLYWKIVNGIKNIEDLIDAENAYNIIRTRQRLNERNMYLPTDEAVKKKRLTKRG